jgi:hypothetical protein
VKRHKRHEAVEGDLRKAASWYERRVPKLGDRFLDAVEDGIGEILDNPRAWSRPPGVPRDLDVRHYLLYPPFSYYVAYVVDEDGVPFILGVAHCKQLPRFWLRRLRSAQRRTR